MSVKKYTGKILEELIANLDYVEDSQIDRIIDEILDAGHIFTAGAGRSGVAMQAFTNRLMHLGLSVSGVGEISAPHTKAGDLLIIGSGSGETESLVSMAKKAKKNMVKIVLFTMDPQSSLAGMADATAILPGVSPKLRNEGMPVASIQPMGSAFEQMSLLVYDGIVLELMERLRETGETMFARHADLE